jgi:hypothetical protein
MWRRWRRGARHREATRERANERAGELARSLNKKITYRWHIWCHIRQAEKNKRDGAYTAVGRDGLGVEIKKAAGETDSFI